MISNKKITIEVVQRSTDYIVSRLINTTELNIGAILTRKQVDEFIHRKNVTVTIKA